MGKEFELNFIWDCADPTEKFINKEAKVSVMDNIKQCHAKCSEREDIDINLWLGMNLGNSIVEKIKHEVDKANKLAKNKLILKDIDSKWSQKANYQATAPVWDAGSASDRWRIHILARECKSAAKIRIYMDIDIIINNLPSLLENIKKKIDKAGILFYGKKEPNGEFLLENNSVIVVKDYAKFREFFLQSIKQQPMIPAHSKKKENRKNKSFHDEVLWRGKLFKYRDSERIKDLEQKDNSDINKHKENMNKISNNLNVVVSVFAMAIYNMYLQWKYADHEAEVQRKIPIKKVVKNTGPEWFYDRAVKYIKCMSSNSFFKKDWELYFLTNNITINYAGTWQSKDDRRCLATKEYGYIDDIINDVVIRTIREIEYFKNFNYPFNLLLIHYTIKHSWLDQIEFTEINEGFSKALLEELSEQDIFFDENVKCADVYWLKDLSSYLKSKKTFKGELTPSTKFLTEKIDEMLKAGDKIDNTINQIKSKRAMWETLYKKQVFSSSLK